MYILSQHMMMSLAARELIGNEPRIVYMACSHRGGLVLCG